MIILSELIRLIDPKALHPMELERAKNRVTSQIYQNLETVIIKAEDLLRYYCPHSLARSHLHLAQQHVCMCSQTAFYGARQESAQSLQAKIRTWSRFLCSFQSSRADHYQRVAEEVTAEDVSRVVREMLQSKPGVAGHGNCSKLVNAETIQSLLKRVV